MSWIYLPPCLWRFRGAFSGIYYVVSTFGAGACDDSFSEPDESHDDIPDALRALLTGDISPVCRRY